MPCLSTSELKGIYVTWIFLKMKTMGLVWWHMPFIPASLRYADLWEFKANLVLRSELQTNQGYIVRLCLRKINR